MTTKHTPRPRAAKFSTPRRPARRASAPAAPSPRPRPRAPRPVPAAPRPPVSRALRAEIARLRDRFGRLPLHSEADPARALAIAAVHDLLGAAVAMFDAWGTPAAEELRAVLASRTPHTAGRTSGSAPPRDLRALYRASLLESVGAGDAGAFVDQPWRCSPGAMLLWAVGGWTCMAGDLAVAVDQLDEDLQKLLLQPDLNLGDGASREAIDAVSHRARAIAVLHRRALEGKVAS